MKSIENEKLKWTVISYWDGEAADSKVWLYDSKEEAVNALKRLWKQSFDAAVEDDDFLPSKSSCQDFFAVIAWECDLYRYFEVIEQESKEEI